MVTNRKRSLKTTFFFSIIVSISILLVSCGGDEAGETGITPIIDGALARSNEQKLSAYFQDSIKLNKSGSVTNFSNAPSQQSDNSSGATTSKTNIQEKGVDEADLIKTDGRYIYSVKKPSFINHKLDVTRSSLLPETLDSDVIRIMDTQDVTGIKEIKQFTNDTQSKEKPWNITGLYLYEAKKNLIALSSLNQGYYTNWFNSQYFSKQETNIFFIDIEDPKSSEIVSTIHFDGQLIDSRRNGNTLYMVLRHYPDYKFISNENLEATTTRDFLPTYRIGTTEKQPLVKPENCYTTKDNSQSLDVITLVAVDLKVNPPQVNSQCYVGSAEAIYASQNALYLATTKSNYSSTKGIASYNSKTTTDIHKFNYNGLNFDYRGSGEVDGHLGYKQDSKSFRFSEHNGLLRVITFDEDQWLTILPIEGIANQTLNKVTSNNSEIKSPVSISILKDDATNKSLTLVSKLPNKSRPQPIGLPQEKLYATRFIGDRAYVVTFRVTDPLYVLNLSDPNDPLIAGELKIDGYSDYLHPITETLILGIGKDAIPSGTGDDARGAWYQGVKLSLIDVSDPANPIEADKVILGKRGTESTVLNNHHAFTSLQIDNNVRIAIPVELHETENGEEKVNQYHMYKQTGLYRFEINIDSQKIVKLPILEVANAISQPEYFHPITNDRSVFIGENVYYMHNGRFWLQDWLGNDEVIGPK